MSRTVFQWLLELPSGARGLNCLITFSLVALAGISCYMAWAEAAFNPLDYATSCGILLGVWAGSHHGGKLVDANIQRKQQIVDAQTGVTQKDKDA